MQWYARGPKKVHQVLGDLFILVWVIGWGFVGRATHSVVDAMGSPARASARMMQDMVEQLENLSELAGRVPGIGAELGVPFRMLARMLTDLIAQANSQAAETGAVALVVGVIAFAIPVLVMLAVWLPRRITFARGAASSQPFIDEAADLDLYALRAMANVPMAELAKVSDDPVAAWRQGDQQVIRRLAELEFARVGIQRPARPAEIAASARPRHPKSVPSPDPTSGTGD